MANNNFPNDASASEQGPGPASLKKAGGDRWKSDSETVERYDETIGRTAGDYGSDSAPRARRTRLDDPTAEQSSDQSTQSASGLTAGRGAEHRADSEELIRRTSEERDTTPRRYDQPAEADPLPPGTN